MKKVKFMIPILILACVILAVSLLLARCSGGDEQKSPPPALEDVRDELILRIENSKQVNDIFWGEGLPVIKIGSPEADEFGLYTEENSILTDDYGAWEYVDPSKTSIISVDAIKMLAESAYSDTFLKGVYTAQFDGLYDPVTVTVLDPHYYEDEVWIWKNSNSEEEFPSVAVKREFDYSSIKMKESASSDERIVITIDSYPEGKTEVEVLTFTFDKQEDGWYLSSPTY